MTFVYLNLHSSLLVSIFWFIFDIYLCLYVIIFFEMYLVFIDKHPFETYDLIFHQINIHCFS